MGRTRRGEVEEEIILLVGVGVVMAIVLAIYLFKNINRLLAGVK